MLLHLTQVNFIGAWVIAKFNNLLGVLFPQNGDYTDNKTYSNILVSSYP
jgi:hypothetical protein